MTILPYKLDTTNDLVTSPAGLMAVAQLMDSLSLAECIDQHFPLPNSNREFRPSDFIKTFILIQHEGSFDLDDIHHLQDDEALRTVLDLHKLLQATTLGDWRRRMGASHKSRQPVGLDFVKIKNDVEDEIKHRIDKLLNETGVEYRYLHIEEGKAAMVIKDLVEKSNTELLVMGTVGRSGVKSVVMGNTSEMILHHTNCDVVVLK